MIKVSSWGRLSALPHTVHALTEAGDVQSVLARSLPGVAFGHGRSYGDVCLNPGGTIWATTKLDRFVSFDPETGILVCEAGLMLRDIQRHLMPQGWSLPVTPGTQFVTIGGAIANDVHGKNHHSQGSFGDHIRRIRLVRTDGQVIECGPDHHGEWFAATVGGLGLTGLITEVELQLLRCQGEWVETETLPFATLEEFSQITEASIATWDYTVSWVDCTTDGGGRGLFSRGNSTDRVGLKNPKKRRLSVPITPPLSLINRFSTRAFNQAYFTVKKDRVGRTLSHYEPFFYPLDNLRQWNRLYGPKGFFQYQCVVPHRDGLEAIQAILKEISLKGDGSFLAVLKTFGDRKPRGLMSFPQPGITLALDFPNEGKRTLGLLDRLDAIVRQIGGRVYLAKDARLSREMFEASYPNLNEFLKYRDPGMSSSMSRRLMGS